MTKRVGPNGLWLSTRMPSMSYNFASRLAGAAGMSRAIQAHVRIADGASVSLET